MVRLLRVHSIVSDLAKLTVAAFVLFYSMEVMPLAPSSRFINFNISESREFLAYNVALFSILYVSSKTIGNPKEYQKVQNVLIKLDNMLSANGVKLAIKEVEYIKNQPEVVYCTFHMGEDIRIARVFDMTVRSGVYPARILYETTFRNIGKVVQIISKYSYDVICMGEEKVVKKPLRGLRAYTGKAASLIMCAISAILDIKDIKTDVLKDVTFIEPWCFIIGLSALFLAAILHEFKDTIKAFFWPSRLESVDKSSHFFVDPVVQSLDSIIQSAATYANPKLVAVETGWLSLFYGKKQAAALFRALAKKYYGRLKIIYSDSPDNLFSMVLAEADKHNISFSNTVVLGNAKNSRQLGREWFKSKGAVCINVDTSLLEHPATDMKTNERIYVNIVEILDKALRISDKEEVKGNQYIRLIYDPLVNPKFAVFILNPYILDKYVIDRIYRKQMEAIKSA